MSDLINGFRNFKRYLMKRPEVLSKNQLGIYSFENYRVKKNG